MIGRRGGELGLAVDGGSDLRLTAGSIEGTLTTHSHVGRDCSASVEGIEGAVERLGVSSVCGGDVEVGVHRSIGVVET